MITFLYASIHEVVWALVISILLVVLVVYFFLQDFKAPLIPTLAIFVSVIGTFGFMAVAGFSINLLTLFALVLAIGTVVDNAIIVAEAVQSKFDAGYKSSYMATNDAKNGITSAIVVSTIIFMAVFIPTSMMGGTSGFTNNGGIVVNPGQWLLNAVGQLMQPIFNRGRLRAGYKTADAVAKTELLMRHSPTNYLEVLTAQQALLGAQQNEVQCRYDEIAATVSLYHALGGGK